MEERRENSRRHKMIRNIFSYLNRRDLFKRGRRHDEDKYADDTDWASREHKDHPDHRPIEHPDPDETR